MQGNRVLMRHLKGIYLEKRCQFRIVTIMILYIQRFKREAVLITNKKVRRPVLDKIERK